jgi:type I restriction enzyme M protein
MDDVFKGWKTKNTEILKSLTKGLKPKQVIFRISEDLLTTYTGKALMDKYDVYQHLMDYWNEIMQDDCYYLAIEGWKAELSITKQTKSVTEWDCDLVPKTLVIDRYFLPEKNAIEQLEAEKETILAEITELEENLPDGVDEDDWILNEVKNDKGKITKTLVDDKMRDLNIEILKISDTKTKKEITKIIKDTFDKAKRTDGNTEAFAKLEVLQSYLNLVEKESKVKDKIKKALAGLDKKVIERYKTLTEEEIKQLVVDDKWMTVLERNVKTEMERISQRLTQRIKELAERYETTLPQQTTEVAELESKVNAHLQKMGFVWN